LVNRIHELSQSKPVKPRKRSKYSTAVIRRRQRDEQWEKVYRDNLEIQHRLENAPASNYLGRRVASANKSRPLHTPAVKLNKSVRLEPTRLIVHYKRKRLVGDTPCIVEIGRLEKVMQIRVKPIGFGKSSYLRIP
jgi:hypothetical protein